MIQLDFIKPIRDKQNKSEMLQNTTKAVITFRIIYDEKETASGEGKRINRNNNS